MEGGREGRGAINTADHETIGSIVRDVKFVLLLSCHFSAIS